MWRHLLKSLYQLSLAWTFVCEVYYPKSCRFSTSLKDMPILYQLPIKPKLLHFTEKMVLYMTVQDFVNWTVKIIEFQVLRAL